MRVLFVYADLNCSVTKRLTFDLSKNLKKIVELKLKLFTKLDSRDFEENDVVFFQRLGANGGRFTTSVRNKYIELIKNNTHAVTFYQIDDLIFDDYNGMPKVFMELSDHVIVPNHTLEKFVLPYTKSPIVWRTFIDETFQLPIAKISDQFKISAISIGGAGDEFLYEVFSKLPADIKVNLVGSYIKCRELLGINHYPIIQKYPLYQLLVSSDMILNPVSNSLYAKNLLNNRLGPHSFEDFASCKSEIKYAKAGFTKTVMLSAPSNSYKHAIKNGVNGYLCEEDVSKWVDLILEVKNNFPKHIVENAHKDVMENYTCENRAKELKEIFEECLKGSPPI